MKILVYPNPPIATSPTFYAVDLFITDYGFDYQLREAVTLASLTSVTLESGAVADPSSKHDLSKAEYQTETVAVFGPITERIAVKFDEFRAREDFHDYAAYVLPIKLLDGVWDWAKDPKANHPWIRKEILGFTERNSVYNITAATMSSKRRTYAAYNAVNGGRVISLQIPLKNSGNNDWQIEINVPSQDLLRVDPSQSVIVNDGTLSTKPFAHHPYPKFDVETATVSATGTVDISFKLYDPDSNATITDISTDIYVTSKGGRLNKSVVTTVNGVGTVTFIPEYLAVGDIIKVSCGFKYFSGTSDCLVTVV